MQLDDLPKQTLETNDKYDKLRMAKNGLCSMYNVDTKLAHELSDCLWSILVLACKYHLNVGQELNEPDKHIERVVWSR